MNFSTYMIRSTTSGGNKNHHRHESGIMNSKKGKSVIRKITKLCQKKKKEVKIVSILGGYGAILKENIDPHFQKGLFFLYKVLLEVDTKKGNYFAFYSYNNSWFYTKDSNISSLIELIKRVEGVKV